MDGRRYSRAETLLAQAQGEYKTALAYLVKEAERMPENAIIFAHLGDVQHALGKKQLAGRVL